MQGDTIAAVCTPLGEGGISSVRITGPDAIKTAEKIFSSKSRERNLSRLKGYSAAFGTVHDGEEILDDAVALVFKKPKSYTGEDTVEISVHGGTYLIKRVLRAALNAGARVAEGGEFTRMAFENGKVDLTEAEAVMGIISATGKQALNIAVRNKNGAVYKKVNEIADGLLYLASQIAVFSDYPDDDTLVIGHNDFVNALDTAYKKLQKLINDYDRGRFITSGINTVIVGSPNAGKSTLMNMLSGTRRSIVTAVAGTTRDVVEETVNLGGFTLRLADTAGIHNADDEVEKIGIETALERLETADLCLAVFDLSRSFSDDDRDLISKIKNRSAIIVLNKNDLPIKADTELIKNTGIKTVEISAINKTGWKELETAIAEVLKTASLDENAEILGSERQYQLVLKALKSVAEAKNALISGVTLDAVGVMTDDALGSLFELCGKRVTTEVANEVFKNFCVGK